MKLNLKLLTPFFLFIFIFLNALVLSSQDSAVDMEEVGFQNENYVLDSSTGPQQTLSFSSTFVRGPFALLTGLAALAGCIFSGTLELLFSIFNGFEPEYANTEAIWSLGLEKIFIEWWWDISSTEYLVFTLLFWTATVWKLLNMSRLREKTA